MVFGFPSFRPSVCPFTLDTEALIRVLPCGLKYEAVVLRTFDIF